MSYFYLYLQHKIRNVRWPPLVPPPPPITHIKNGIKRFLYIQHSLPLIFGEQNFSFEGVRPKKASKFDLFKKCETKILMFEYFQKIPSEMNSTKTFYSILIPNTSFVKFSFIFILFVLGSQNSKKKFNDIEKLFQLGFVRRFFY